MSIQWFPGHMNAARKKAAESMEKTDLVIEVLDAGGISAGGEFSARTGGEFRLLSAVELLGNVTMLRPAVQVVSEEVEVVRGSQIGRAHV